MKLTAIIVCQSKREKGFERALKSVGFADEVMVEERPEIVDYAAARNEAMRKAGGEWVLFLDSDEEISGGLKKEIRQITDKSYKDYKNYNISGAYFRRKDCFLGRWLGHGETASVRLLRLGRKDAGRWERPIHEMWMIGGRTEELKNPILHYSHQSVDGMVEKLDRYSEIEAEYRFYKTNKLTKEPARNATHSVAGGQTNKKTNKSSNNKIIKIWLLVEMAVFPAG
ncbi:MAG TPA: glycosyltransferase, partial [Patescibacteria group bacterium]|nr:glycosyltransferase [Patescibacteria group bacterium]